MSSIKHAYLMGGDIMILFLIFLFYSIKGYSFLVMCNPGNKHRFTMVVLKPAFAPGVDMPWPTSETESNEMINFKIRAALIPLVKFKVVK